eukprot:GEMP01042682.1.p1 GENE.GEMP01042682.1~~GEMP01042682.1.p1  ORF type:complete len:159 (+),score=27.10 GEMP01042682.1:68-544(+)
MNVQRYVSESALIFVVHELMQHSRAHSHTNLQEIGFALGIRIAECLCAEDRSPPISAYKTDTLSQKELIKWMCKDCWTYLWQKNADRLQTNRRGGYVIQDSDFAWIRTMQDESDVKALLPLPVGILRGILSALGLKPIVDATIGNSLPTIIFNVTLED